MTKKITLLCTLLLVMYLPTQAQLLVNDFETGSAAPIDAIGGITFEVVDNPSKTGANTSDKVLKVGRNDNKWWGLVGIDVNPDLAVSSSEKKYLSIMVNYPAQPDLGIRLAATSDAANGPGGDKVLRALNTYTSLGEWQEIVFEIRDDITESGTSFTSGTIFRVDLHPDMGFNNDPVGQVLSASEFGYIDNVRVLDQNPLSTKNYLIGDKNVTVFPSSVTSTFQIKAPSEVKSVSVFNILGKDVSGNTKQLNENTFDISSLTTGMYILKIRQENGTISTKKIIKNL